MSKIYSARWVLPIIGAPIDDGAIIVDNATIVAIGTRTGILEDFRGMPHEAFGNAAIIPGLVNAHSHLELTVMRGFLETEEQDFFAWLQKLTLARLKMSEEDLFISAVCGAIEAARAGVTCLGDSSSFATQSMRALNEIGLRGIVYQESFGPDSKLAVENVGKLRAQLDAMRAVETDRVRAGVSPHAPYTVSTPQLEMISRLAIDEDLPLMMHAAESEAERQFMVQGTGAFADGLRARGIDWQPPGVSTVRYLHDHGVLETKPLLAHCINVDESDLQLIRDARAGVAHCPTSNAKLRHGRAPFAKFIEQGLNVGLGSDSVASNNVCDMLAEARFATLLARLPGVSGPAVIENAASKVISMNAPADERLTAPLSGADTLFAATAGGARALGLAHRIGSLRPQLDADFAVISLDHLHQQPVYDPATALIFSGSGRDVLLTVVAGKEIYREGCLLTVPEDDFRSRLDQVSAKLKSESANGA